MNRCSNCATPVAAGDLCGPCALSPAVAVERRQVHLLTNALERANTSTASLKKKLSTARAALDVTAGNIRSLKGAMSPGVTTYDVWQQVVSDALAEVSNA